MKVLIVGDDHGQQTRLAAAMMQTGFQVICVETARSAGNYLNMDMIDVLVLTETRSARIGNVWSCISHSRNPGLSVIVMSDRTGPGSDELFEDIPALYCVLALDMAPVTIAHIALASILPQHATLAVPSSVRPPAGFEASGRDAVLSGGASRTLLQPIVRPPTRPRSSTVHADYGLGEQAAGMVASVGQSLAATARSGSAALPPMPMPIPVPLAPRHADAFKPMSNIGSDLAALERELELVNRDRPSVLGPSIADKLPDWSQPAPNLAMLTDGQLTEPVPTKPLVTGHERRLSLGVTMQ